MKLDALKIFLLKIKQSEQRKIKSTLLKCSIYEPPLIYVLLYLSTNAMYILLFIFCHILGMQ